ncbi:hypothetical protein ACFFRR_000005 [Megaselia abdita]
MSIQKKKISFKEPLQTEDIIDSDSPINSENEEEIQCGQVFMESVNEEIPEAVNPATVAEIIPKEKVKKNSQKRKAISNTGKKTPTKKAKMNIDQIMKKMQTQDLEEDSDVNVISLLMIIWTPDFLITSIAILQTFIKKSLRVRQLEAKKVIYQLVEALLLVQKKLMDQNIELEKCSLKHLITELLSLELYTTFLESDMTMETVDWIVDSYSENLQELSSSSSTTTTTCTSSMTVPSPTVPVDVPSQTSSETKSLEDSLDELYQVGNSQLSIGSISQSISRKTPESTSTLISPGERGFQVVKMDVYDFSKIYRKPKQEWWKEARSRSTFILNSCVDPNYRLVMQLLMNVTKQIQKIPEVKCEVKENKSSNS